MASKLMGDAIETGLRDALSEDLPRLLTLNQKALPHVNSLTHEDMLWFLEHSAYFKVTSGLKGFVIALEPGLDYASSNYRWFLKRFDNFFYIDRVIISKDFRGQGLGRQLYKDVIETARRRFPRLTCEVNSTPPNPKSMVFHETFGFSCVGTQQTEGGKKEVKLLALDLHPFN